MTSLISIVMPYYKKEKYVEESINSILNQSYNNFEIILIDDEADNNNNFLKKILNLDSRIRLITNKKNLGAGESRNQGIRRANGEYIAFCDSDDLWKKKKLETQLNFMIEKNLDFSFTSYEIIDEDRNFISTRRAENMLDFPMLKNSCDIGLSTVMVKKKIFDNLDYKFARLKTKEDYVLWLKLAKNKVKLIGLKETLTSWRRSNNSLSSSVYQKLVDGYRVYRVYMGYSMLISLLCLIRLSINYIFKK